jgi:hypothetical protein
MFVSHETLSGKVGIIAQLVYLCNDVVVNWNVVLSDHNALSRRVVVKAVELMIANLGQPEPFGVCY